MQKQGDNIVRKIKHLYLLMNYHIDEELKSCGLARSQFQVINFIYKTRKLPQKDLQEMMQVEPATLTGIIDTLEKKSLLARVENKTDKRSNTLQLTQKGKKLRESIPSINAIIERKMFQAITENDKKQTLNIIEKIIQNLKK